MSSPSSDFGLPNGHQQNTMPQSSVIHDKPNKPKGKPTVTPRSFGRFFAPRSSLSGGRISGSTRNPLGDITACGGNKLYKVGKRRSPRKDSIRLFDEDENPESGSNNLPNGRKRALYSPETSPELSSPLKRLKRSTPAPIKGLDLTPTSLGSPFETKVTEDVVRPKRIVKSKFRYQVGQISRRELDMPCHAYDKPLTDSYIDWRSHTANFYSGPEDLHITRNVVSDDNPFTIPFCAAACNTNSLVAIGDEEGGIRLLETEKDNKTPFKTPFLSFRPHINAILDLDFCHNDSLLATASGDQTGQVIDMSTQTTIYELQGHHGSVKQVRFQPSSGGNVLATSSRDGNIQVWDLRCKGYSAPVVELKINLGGTESDKATTYSSSSRVTGAARVSLILEAHGGAAGSTDTLSDASRRLGSQAAPAKKPSRNDVSITALSWMLAEAPHLLLSGSEANATVKLWDIRMKPNLRTNRVTPLSSTEQPDAHGRHRTFGLTSMALSGDGSRLYTLCKDSTVYAYSMKHMILGSAPEFSESWKPRKSHKEKTGLGPLYAFRHEKLKAATFYVKSALRPARLDHGEVLAVGSTDSCAVLFPTDERQFNAQGPPRPYIPTPDMPITPALTPKSSCPQPSRSISGFRAMQNHETIPVYGYGAALVGGHGKEVTCTTWSSEGELVTVGDDHRCRVWREDRDKAASLRCSREGNETWGHGWADLGGVGGDWDDEE